jgi:hypothetical protein
MYKRNRIKFVDKLCVIDIENIGESVRQVEDQSKEDFNKKVNSIMTERNVGYSKAKKIYIKLKEYGR